MCCSSGLAHRRFPFLIPSEKPHWDQEVSTICHQRNALKLTYLFLFPSTDSVINKLLLYAVNTGLLTAWVASFYGPGTFCLCMVFQGICLDWYDLCACTLHEKWYAINRIYSACSSSSRCQVIWFTSPSILWSANVSALYLAALKLHWCISKYPVYTNSLLATLNFRQTLRDQLNNGGGIALSSLNARSGMAPSSTTVAGDVRKVCAISFRSYISTHSCVL